MIIPALQVSEQREHLKMSASPPDGHFYVLRLSNGRGAGRSHGIAGCA